MVSHHHSARVVCVLGAQGVLSVGADRSDAAMSAKNCDLCGEEADLFFCSYCLRCVCERCLVMPNHCEECWDEEYLDDDEESEKILMKDE
jgi:hypothetical protein